jgi:hypothetical protein
MEMSHGNLLCSCVKQKCHFFHFTKWEIRRVEQVLWRGGWYQWDGRGGEESGEEGEYGADSVYMYVNGKMIPIESIPGTGAEEIKENDGGGEFN